MKYLLSMIYSIKSILHIKIRIIILSTEKASYDGLYTILTDMKIINNEKEEREREKEGNYIRIDLLYIPPQMFTEYGSFVHKLCAKHARTYFSILGFGPWEISRFCDVNSPMHYLFVDVVIEYIKSYCSQAKLVIVTNADNSYLPSFFHEILKRSQKFDVIMSNTLYSGNIMRVEAKRGSVDLGAYASSIPFLRETGITFTGSVPDKPLANDYHDADGLFIESLQAHNARFSIIDTFLFAHN